MDVLTEARHRSKKQVELIEARLNPKADVPSTIRKVAGPVAESLSLSLAAGSAPAGDGPAGGAATPEATSNAAPPSPAPTAIARRPEIRPLTPERYRLQFTISKAAHDTLRHVQDLLCREIPNGDPAAIFERALDLLARDVEKKKLAATDKPRPPRARKDGTRDATADVKRAVWERDGGRCAFEGPPGRCAERRYLEWHHVQPFGHQGPPTVDNISLRCRAHNVYESDLVFGRFVPRTDRGGSGNHAASREIPPFRNGGAEEQDRDGAQRVPRAQG